MLLLNHLHSLKTCNVFSFSKLDNMDFNKTSFNPEKVGLGICGLHNLLNQSCGPNSHFLIRNGEHVLFATRPIKKGEQVSVMTRYLELHLKIARWFLFPFFQKHCAICRGILSPFREGFLKFLPLFRNGIFVEKDTKILYLLCCKVGCCFIIILSWNIRNMSYSFQIFTSYGSSYADRPREERIGRLQTIHQFTCNCEACRNKWPMEEYMLMESFKVAKLVGWFIFLFVRDPY